MAIQEKELTDFIESVPERELTVNEFKSLLSKAEETLNEDTAGYAIEHLVLRAPDDEDIMKLLNEDQGGSSDPFDKADNAFCPTGQGGGVDPTCSPGKSSTTMLHGTTQDRVKSILQEGIVPKANLQIMAWPGVGSSDKADKVYTTDSLEVASWYGKTHSLYTESPGNFAVLEIEVPDTTVGITSGTEGGSKFKVVAYDSVPPAWIKAVHVSNPDGTLTRQSVKQFTANSARRYVPIFFQDNDEVANAFCPTGIGGGVDPTCSPGEGGGLSEAAKQAVSNWWGANDPEENGYVAINSALRSGKNHPAAAGLMEAIDKATPLAQDTVFYRGLSIPKNGEVDSNLKKGHSVFDSGFWSVTSDAQVANQFATWASEGEQAAIVRIKVAKGTKMADIPSGIGEKLLPPRSRFIVERVTTQKGIKHVEARYAAPI